MLDLDRPDDRLQALIRLRGTPDGEAWLWYQGVLYGRAEGDVMRPLVGYTSVLKVRYERLAADGYFFIQRESNHYYGLDSGEPLGDFVNPYTGTSVVAVGYVSPPWRHRFGLDGTFPENAPGDYWTEPSGRLWPLDGDAGDLWLTEARVNEMGAGIDRETFPDAWAGDVRRSADVATYRAPRELILDTRVDDVRASLAVVSDTPWVLWLLMGTAPGHMVWYGQGSKCCSLDSLPADIRRRVEAVHPGFLDDPWGIDGAPYASAAQLRQLRAEGRI